MHTGDLSETGHSSLEEVEKYAIMWNKFEYEGCIIEQRKKSRIYLSVREQLKRKIEQGNPPEMLLMKYKKKRGDN